MIVMTVIIKMKMILLHLDNHKNASKILLFKILNNFSNKTPLGETGCLSNPYFLLTGCLGIQFLFHSPFPTQSVRLPLVTYLSLCSTCVTCRMLCHVIGHQVLPTQPLPREAEDFTRGDKYFKHVPPPTYLIYFSPKAYT